VMSIPLPPLPHLMGEKREVKIAYKDIITHN